MLDFRSSNRNTVRNYQSRREQWRLLLLIASFGIVLVLIRTARQPETAEAVSQIFADANPAEVNEEPIVAAATIQPANSASAVAVSPEALAAIRDNAPFRAAEQSAWFAMLADVKRMNANQLSANSLGNVDYVQLTSQPDFYRTKVVTIFGTVRRVTIERPAKNDLGIERYYRLVIQPSGGSAFPIFAYCLELPVGFPQGDDVDAEARVTGIFFKNLSYQSNGGPAIAPVLVANNAAMLGSMGASDERTPIARDSKSGADENVGTTKLAIESVEAGNSAAKFNEVMQLAGWTAERWATFIDDQPLSDGERHELLELLWRLRTFDSISLDAWSSESLSPSALIAESQSHRGVLSRFSGRVRRVSVQQIAPEVATRLELPAFFECEVDFENGEGASLLLVPRVPREWAIDAPLDEPVSFDGVFLKRLPPRDGNLPTLLLAARHVAWHPTRVNEPTVSFGESILGELGMDVGLLDNMRNHLPIRREEREAFFAMLDATTRVGAHQLVRFAQGDLESVGHTWTEELASKNKGRAALAREVIDRAKSGFYSVAPMFNDADRQIGRLVTVDGVARRVVRVEVGSAAAETANDIQRQFGIDHYYEMDVFTDDSQNRPLVFCVRELPAGFPTGAGLSEPVRMAGFFFKSWRYIPRGTAISTTDANDNKPVPAGSGLISPLLIGRAPVVLVVAESDNSFVGPLAIGLIVISFAGIWGIVWWFSRGDRQFHRERLAPSFSLSPGESLNHLQLPDPAATLDRLSENAADAKRKLS